MQLCEEQSWTMILSSFNPLVEQPGDPLSEQGRKNRAICRGAKHAFRSNLGSPTAHSRVHARRSISINAKGRKAQQEARAPVEPSHKGRKRRSCLSFGVENVTTVRGRKKSGNEMKKGV